IGLFLVMYVPSLSTVLVDADIRKAYAEADRKKESPREAWLMQCVQEDRSNPIPCTEEDKKRFGKDGTTNPYAEATPQPTATAAPTDTAKPGADDDLLKQMMGEEPKKDDKKDDKPKSDDDLLKEMMGDSSAKPAASGAPSAKPSDPNEDLLKEMMGEPKK